MPFADLHTHTLCSDGTQSPTENVVMAQAAGLSGVAITDHDSVGGIAEAMEAGRRYAVEIVPGVEISTVHGGQDIHVLGYYVDDKDERFLERLRRLRGTRSVRNEMIAERLRSLGMAVTMEEVIANAEHKEGAAKPGAKTVGRPHIADLLVKKGYVADVAEAFRVYLGRDGAAYANPPRIAPAEAVHWILEAGGAPVLAHPGLYRDDALIPALVKEGLRGIEVSHPDHDEADERRYAALAQEHALIATAGSDFHGTRGGEVFHAPIGAKRTGMDTLTRLKNASGKRG